MTKRSAAASLASAAEASVVALARAGERGAFDELVRRRQSNTRNLLRRLCRDTSLADDLAQETFLQVWRQLHGLRSSAAFGGWLRQIAVNVWLQHTRSNERFAELDQMETAAAATSVSARLDLDAALGALNPWVRLCIVLSYHEGLSHGEISASANIPLGTVKSHIARGTVRLRELLAEYNSVNERQTHAR